MSITANEGGVLRELETVTSNEGGVLYELDTVHANEGGVLNEIFSANTLPTELTWKVYTTVGDLYDSNASLESFSGLTVTFQCSNAQRAVYSNSFRLRAGTTIRITHKCKSTVGSYSQVHNRWLFNVGSTTSLSIGTSYTVPEDGYYYIALGGMLWDGPAGKAYSAIYEVNISFS